MALFSNGTEVAGSGTVKGSASNLTSIPAPDNADIRAGVASASMGGIGSYMIGYNYSNYNGNNALSPGSTWAGSTLRACSASYSTRDSNSRSGTWRLMGGPVTSSGQNNNAERIAIWLRIS